MSLAAAPKSCEERMLSWLAHGCSWKVPETLRDPRFWWRCMKMSVRWQIKAQFMEGNSKSETQSYRTYGMHWL